MLIPILYVYSFVGALAGLWAVFLFLLIQEMRSWRPDWSPVAWFMGAQVAGAVVALALKSVLAG